MKKFLVSALLATPFVMNAQVATVDFEDLTLSAHSYYNGSDSAGKFTSTGIDFSNTYDTEYDYWAGGFAYSNMQDDTTAGFANMYSAYPAKGANNSANYAVFQQGFGAEYIDFKAPVSVNKFSISNTTYAYLSMKEGDSFGKKFGSTTNANGDDDGTNGKDFFFVRVYASLGGTTMDSTDIYLADFRSNDSTEHFILDTWKEVSFGSGLHADKLSFALFSSDNGDYGMNTPAYFALDDIVVDYELAVKETVKMQLSVYPNPTTEVLNISNFNGLVNIYSMSGMLVKSAMLETTSTLNVSELNAGLYRIVTENGSSVTFEKR